MARRTGVMLLVLVTVACGAGSDQTAEKACENASCPPGTLINLSASSVEECSAHGTVSVVTGSGGVEAKCFSKGTCEYACAPAEACCGEVEWTETTYNCSQVCCQDGTPPPCQTACGDGVCEPGEDPTDCPEDCGETCGDGACTGGETPAWCPEDCTGKPCVPDCTERECGSDGCDGICGECWEDEFCKAGVCTPNECLPSCDGKACGSNGCGGSCGTCNVPNWVCEDGKCICPGPSCQDTCCLAGEVCTTNGKCCLPNCSGKECGSDGCGGECGECPDGTMCNGGECLDVTCDDGNDVEWDGCTNGQISEWQVNTTSTFDQTWPVAIGIGNGDFLVVWTSEYAAGDCEGEKALWFAPDGDAMGEETQLHSEPSCAKFPQPTATVDGGAIVTWSNRSMLVFNGEGEKVTETTLDTFMTPSGGGDHQNMAALGENELVLVDSMNNSDGMVGDIGFEIYRQHFDMAGISFGDPLQVNQYVLGHQKEPVVASAPGGTYVVAWQSEEQDGDAQGVIARAFNPSGTPMVDEFLVNSHTEANQVAPHTCHLGDDSFVVVWRGSGPGESTGIWARVIVLNGGVQFASEQEIHLGLGTEASIASTKSGWVAVTWVSLDFQPTIHARVFDKTLTPIFDEVEVSTSEFGVSKPRIASLSDSSLIVVWQATVLDGSGYGIFAQRFDADGNKLYH